MFILVLISDSNTILQPFHGPLEDPGRMDPLMDVNVLRWHIFKRGSGGWEEETTAHNCPFQPLACTRTAHSCCVIDAHSPTCQQLRPVPGFRRKCLPVVVPMSHFLCIWMAWTNIQQTKAFLPSAPSQHIPHGKQCIRSYVFGTSSLIFIQRGFGFSCPYITTSSHFLSNPHRHILNLCVPEIHLTVLLRPTIW